MPLEPHRWKGVTLSEKQKAVEGPPCLLIFATPSRRISGPFDAICMTNGITALPGPLDAPRVDKRIRLSYGPRSRGDGWVHGAA